MCFRHLEKVLDIVEALFFDTIAVACHRLRTEVTMTKMISVMALMTLAACGASVSGECNKAADCAEEAELEFDVDACVTAGEEGEAAADEAGCGSEYKSAFKCSSKNAECKDGLYYAESGCDTELEEYINCVLGGTTGSES